MSKRWKYSLIELGVLIFVVAFFYQMENLRGARVLRETLATVEVAGVSVNGLEDPIFTPEENFFDAPGVSSLSDFRLDSDRSLSLYERIIFRNPAERAKFLEMEMPDLKWDRLGVYLNDRVDAFGTNWKEDLELLAAWVQESPEYTVSDPAVPDARLLLDAIDDRFEGELKALAEAAKKPFSVLPVVELDESEMWPGRHSVIEDELHRIVTFLSFRAALSAEVGDSQRFRDSVAIMTKLIEGIAGQHTASSVYYWSNGISDLLTFVWGAKEQGLLSRDDLQWLSAHLEGIPLHRYAGDTFVQMLCQLRVSLDGLKRSRPTSGSYFEYYPALPTYERHFIKVLPGGWFDRCQAHAIESLHSETIEGWQKLDFRYIHKLGSISPTRASILDPDTFLYGRYIFHTGLDRLAASAFVYKELCEVELQLEMHRHEFNSYPESLNELIPRYRSELPKDPFASDALQYRKDGGSFVLYSVGMNLTDEGGKSAGLSKAFSGLPIDDWRLVAPPGRESYEFADRLKALAIVRAEKRLGRKLNPKQQREVWNEYLRTVDESSPVYEEAQRLRIIEREKEKFLLE